MPVPVNCFRVFDDLEGARCIDWIDANGAVTPTAVKDEDGELETGWYNSAMQMIEHDRLKPDRGLPSEGKFLWDGVNLRLIKIARLKADAEEPTEDPLTNHGRGLKGVKDSRSIFMASLVDELDDDELADVGAALLAYTSSDYVPINSELRVPTGRMPDDLWETIKLLDHLFSHTSLTEDLVGTRLLTVDSMKRIRDHVGSQFKDTAFVSVHGSIDMDLVLGGEVEVVEVVIPQGSPALPVMHIAPDKAQKEIIVARNSRWLVSEQADVLRLTLIVEDKG